MLKLEDVEALATKLICQHLPAHWGVEFGWTKSRSTFGLAGELVNGEGEITRRRIRLSRVLTPHRELENVRNTILHEIAHLLVGNDQAHNAVWRAACVKIGLVNPNVSSDDLRGHDILKPTWVAVYQGRVVREWLSKPRSTTFSKVRKLEVRGIPESRGMVEIMTVDDYEGKYLRSSDE